ncbi:CPBP family intramembrane glutamic endopeptidase [Halobaculum sp. MBLA0147]|uniref:CPBP family intramembrane glutamic endopeptidase n=1 Tax=Halobaculum sp. MBLA0147 TaxID=3079934 RepID=UPI003525C61A
MSTITDAVKRHPIVTFLLVTFGWSLGADAIAYSLYGRSPPTLAIVVRAWGPLVGALVTAGLSDASVRDLLGQVRRLRHAPRYYLVALTVPILFNSAGAVVYVASGVDVKLLNVSPVSFVVSFLVVLLLAGGLEEFGWRGFMQPRLQREYAAGTAAVVTGLAWVLWHSTFFAVFDFQRYLSSVEGFTIYLVEIVAFSVLLAWIYNKTSGGLALALVMHAAHNWGPLIVPADTAPGGVERLAEFAPPVAAVVVVVVIVAVDGWERLADSSPDPDVGRAPATADD